MYRELTQAEKAERGLAVAWDHFVEDKSYREGLELMGGLPTRRGVPTDDNADLAGTSAANASRVWYLSKLDDILGDE